MSRALRPGLCGRRTAREPVAAPDELELLLERPLGVNRVELGVHEGEHLRQRRAWRQLRHEGAAFVAALRCATLRGSGSDALC